MRYAQNENGQPVNIKNEHDQVIDNEGTKHPMALAMWEDSKIASEFGYYPYNISTDHADRFQNEVRSWTFDNVKFDESVIITAKPQAEIDAIMAQELTDRKTEAENQLSSNDIIKAVVLSINDGSLVTGANLTNSQLKTIIRNHVN